MEEWAKYVNKTIVVRDHVPFYDLPGYKELLSSFLIEMQSRDINSYPDKLIDASLALLYNEKLLNDFVMILYQKTSRSCALTVQKTYDIINKWLQFLIANKKLFPT